MLQVTPLSERRGILPLEQLESQESASSALRVSQYRLDLGHRKLPKPTIIHSDNERDAGMKNRREQSRLDKTLDHLKIQSSVYSRIFERERHAVRVHSAKFQYHVEKTRQENYASMTSREPMPIKAEVPPVTSRLLMTSREPTWVSMMTSRTLTPTEGRSNRSMNPTRAKTAIHAGSRPGQGHSDGETTSSSMLFDNEATSPRTVHLEGRPSGQSPRMAGTGGQPLPQGDRALTKLSQNTRPLSKTYPQLQNRLGFQSSTSASRDDSRYHPSRPHSQRDETPPQLPARPATCKPGFIRQISYFSGSQAKKELQQELNNVKLNRKRECKPQLFDFNRALDLERATREKCSQRFNTNIYKPRHYNSQVQTISVD